MGIYSTAEPLLRGHPDERPLPLERPLHNENLNINVLISTPDERPSLLKGHFSDAKRWPHKRGFTVLIFIYPLECFFSIAGRIALDRNLGLGYITQLLRLITEDLKRTRPHRLCHIYYLAFYTVQLHCQTPTLKPVCQAARQFVLLLWWSLVWLGWIHDQGLEKRTH